MVNAAEASYTRGHVPPPSRAHPTAAAAAGNGVGVGGGGGGPFSSSESSRMRMTSSPSCGGIAADMLWLCKPLDPLMDEL